MSAGGAATGISSTYVVTSPKKEDLEAMIYDISPMDTYCLTNFARTTVKSTLHEWQVDALAAPVVNARLEGAEFSGTALTNTLRIKNYTQISSKDVVVSGTAEAMDMAGFNSILAYGIAKKGRELKRDIETAILSRALATAGVAGSARISAGMLTYMESSLTLTSHIGNATVTTTAWSSSGIPNSAGNDISTTTTTFLETALAAGLAIPWTNGGETDAIILGTTLRAKLNAFTGVAQRTVDVGRTAKATIIGAADVYVSSFGIHKVVMSRYADAHAVALVDTSTWSVGYLRPFQRIQIGRSGDNYKETVLAEWTLIGRSFQGNAKITNVT